MKLSKKLAPIILSGALALLPQKLNSQSLNVNLFPEMPVYRSVMADSDILKTELNMPQGLIKETLNTSLKELVPYFSLSKEIPLLSFDIKSEEIPSFIPIEKRIEARSKNLNEGISLSDKIFSASLIAGGKLNFPKEKNPEYDARAELFLGSPMIDDYLSDGNKLLLNAGTQFKGNLNLEDLANKSISSLAETLNNKGYSFFGNAYIVIKSPYSNQMSIVRIGLEDLFSKNETPKLNLSSTLEFPPLLSWVKGLENAKIIPYLSAGMRMPLNSEGDKEVGEFGVKITGESKKSILGYVRAELENKKGFSYSSGIKLDL